MAVNAQRDPGEHRLQVVLLGATQSPMESESTPLLPVQLSSLLEEDNLYQDKHIM